mgnify:CR=1 FL=1
MKEIYKAALLAVREGRVLLCRKRGTPTWILPGGKIEAGEAPEEALRREIGEELTGVRLGEVRWVRCYEHHNPEGVPLRMEVFVGELEGEPGPAAEIEELRWQAAAEPCEGLSPSLRDLIMPEVAAGRISVGVRL